MNTSGRDLGGSFGEPITVYTRRQVKLWSLCGPRDDGAPVVTIMLEGED